MKPLRQNESVVGQASPTRFGSGSKSGAGPSVSDARTFLAAGAPADEGAAAKRVSVGRQRYDLLCKRLYAAEEPTFARALDGEHEGEYTTGKAEVTLDTDAIFAMVSTLEYCRGLHSLRLVGLRHASTSLLSREMLSAAVAAIRGAASIRLLDLSDNALTDELIASGAQSPLGRLLTNNTNLTCLILKKNELSLATAKQLLSHLPTNRTLLELDVAENPELKWAGMANEYARLFKENVNLTAVSPRPSPRPDPKPNSNSNAPARLCCSRAARVLLACCLRAACVLTRAPPG